MIPEHQLYLNLEKKYPDFFRVDILGEIDTHRKTKEPLLGFEMCHRESAGSKHLPVFGIFAGVHGVEAVGVKILLSFIEHILEQTRWNRSTQDLLRNVRVVGIPIVNPAGYLVSSRCNGNGVDLMRNAPVESDEQLPFIGGQRYSSRLPYYRGSEDMELENQILIRFIKERIWPAPFSTTMDLHSGFGTNDSLWSPYAKTRALPSTWDEYLKIRTLLDENLKYHVYKFEPQSLTYCTSGDIWDLLHDEYLSNPKHRGLFLPLTLEVGSWIWVKKAPYTLFKIRNLFNPVHPHRVRRVLRRHRPLLDLLMHMTANFEGVFLKRPS